MYDNGDSFQFPDDSSPDLNSGDDVTPTPIVMVSPPETSDDEDPNCSSSTNNNRASQDVFQTPPEDAHPPTSDGITPFPEVDQSDDDDGLPFEDAGDGRGVTVPSGDGFTTELAWERGRFESPLKKLRVPEHELGKLEFQEMVQHSPGCNSGKNLEIDGGDEKLSEEISEVRKPDSSEDERESCIEKSESDEETIQDIMKRTPNVTIEELRRIEGLWLRRDLPGSIGRQVGLSANDGKEGKQEEVAIFDVLKLLKDKNDGNGNGNDEIDKSSFLEISRRRGMTFPRPSWWPEGGF